MCSPIRALLKPKCSILIPIALGIIVMFVRSTFDIMDYGSGFFDSLTGLVIFFMLLGKMFQIKRTVF
jgi:Cu+-exporting ATPase